MRKQQLVPLELMVVLGCKATKDWKTCADTWTDSEIEQLRAQLPMQFHAVPTDWLRSKWITIRKSGKYEGMKVNNGARARKYEDVEAAGKSDEYRQWIESEEFKLIADECKKNAEHRCQLCNAAGIKGTPLHAHHRSYLRIKTPEEIKDLIAVCRPCHYQYHDWKSRGNKTNQVKASHANGKEASLF